MANKQHKGIQSQMLATAIAAYLLTMVTTYPMFLVAALGVGLSGGSFSVGVQYVSTWYPKEKIGTALEPPCR